MLIQFLITSFLMEITPGPNMAYLATVSLAYGRRAGFAIVLGVALGLSAYGILAAVGMAALITEWPMIYEAIRWLGIGYLLWLAFDAWREAAAKDEAVPVDPSGLVLRGFLTNILNPKASLVFVTLVPRFVDPLAGSAIAQGLAFGAVFVAVATFVHVVIVLFAHELRPWLAGGPARRYVGQVSACLLVAVAAWLAWETHR